MAREPRGPRSEDETYINTVDTYTADDFGPSHRWIVFVCAWTGHPQNVGYVRDEHEDEDDRCPCGAPLVAVDVAPLARGPEPREETP